ncbi:MAG TPA: imidazole glycerol phosphate synthase subunit HisH [Candidatus Omnitrophota bacterium]|nr:imidazole glycerol phosphate synthase subunit HisH [Candidatus Omnitrophota bacterium]
MIAIIDYGMGNLRSVEKAFEKVGANVKITQSIPDILKAEKIVLPGVGAIKPAVEKLIELHLVEPIQKSIADGKPFLGICLGLQLLFEKSDEGGDVKGLGILKGTVPRFKSLKVPQMGWNQIHIQQKDCPLYRGIPDGSNFYFCHSYYVEPTDKTIVATTTDYGLAFSSSIAVKNIFGVQFHPEKSQTLGLQILKNFTEIPV